ncbi:outer membrane lipid asymmetry maintenance protein MlaD [Tepidicaulis sp.]|jgi:phospholipid/cholesterol/gamma-HCH transport system substrate-binding protein|uniref:outer membrane lipid asymmetry maintenance protein MlaD n=1 Tax=Tepidicaulis sp. TaxID=1920809 RepID=UPI003B5BD452
MQNNFVETLVGAAVIAVAAGFLAYGYSITDVGRADGYRLTAEFDRVDGLATGSDIRMSGIKVGTVVSQELNPQNYYARVTFKISPDIKLPSDSSAKITSEGLLGGNYVSILPGGSEDYLESGDEIQFTQGSIDLIGLVGQAIFSAQDSQ